MLALAMTLASPSLPTFTLTAAASESCESFPTTATTAPTTTLPTCVEMIAHDQSRMRAEVLLSLCLLVLLSAMGVAASMWPRRL